MTVKREVREDQHGTRTGYAYGCRCRQCKAAQRAFQGVYRARPVSEDTNHGLAGYAQGCRCDVCYDAKSIANGRTYQRRVGTDGENAVGVDQIRQWAYSLGLPTVPHKLPQALIDRWNREHPDRRYGVKS